MNQKELNIYTDGASRGNPGLASIGVYIEDANGNEIQGYKECLGQKTNNEAEYIAICKALSLAMDLGASKVNLYSDSLLCVSQITGKWKIKQDHLRDLCMMIKNKELKFESVKYQHIKREKNKKADALCNEALDEK
ncbi:MAG: ribonuclease HI family protein [Candidatus Gracilibacteria bacterium]|jgi:ribonuclease HI|nr:ribonuclease HI family protein [Candidatus Gracilibacteria bacterium]